MVQRKRVLVVEDEPLIAWDIEAELSERMFQVIGPVATSSAALDLVANERLDSAVLDINLRTETSYDVARCLEEKSIPFLFLTGNKTAILDEFADRPTLAKPIDYQQLEMVLNSLCARGNEN